jgi:hypothetical protein
MASLGSAVKQGSPTKVGSAVANSTGLMLVAGFLAFLYTGPIGVVALLAAWFVFGR